MSEFALRYLKFAEVHQNIQSKYDVQSKDCQILRLVTKHYLEKKPLKVRELIYSSTIASPATIHKSMKSLIAKGLIKVDEDDSDARIKYLGPTPRAMKIFMEIGKQM